jgi:hypothetical protein
MSLNKYWNSGAGGNSDRLSSNPYVARRDEKKACFYYRELVLLCAKLRIGELCLSSHNTLPAHCRWKEGIMTFLMRENTAHEMTFTVLD